MMQKYDSFKVEISQLKIMINHYDSTKKIFLNQFFTKLLQEKAVIANKIIEHQVI